MSRRHPRIVLISQARMESTRLPGKILRDLAGEPMLKRVWQRLTRSELADAVVLAIPDTPANDALEKECLKWGASVFRGPLDDVLARYARAAEAYSAEVVVRVTSDCPFCDPGTIDSVVRLLRSDDSLDYASNNLRRTWPLGLDVEALWVDVLNRADHEAVERHEREHVTPYVYQHPDAFRLANLEAPEWGRRPYRLTIDEPADLDMARVVYSELNPVESNAAEILAFLDAHPEVAAMNADVQNRNVWRPESW